MSRALVTLLLKIVLIQIILLVVPLLFYLSLESIQLDYSIAMYLFVSLATIFTAYCIWIESLYSLKPSPILPVPSYYPPATAIIAAYLPNEAETIIATLHAFERLDYQSRVQIILSYNTPIDLPIESSLRDLEKSNPNLLLLRVPKSHSKAENINYALQYVTGEIVGIFDADHRPEPDSFRKAFQWIHAGYDVVQGHCVISNSMQSWITRLVAIEFEIIYAVSHIGRTQLHDFGIFGGSNGFWKTSVLTQIGMNERMLTEDIDASIRAVENGYKIASDRRIVSLEQAPVTFMALWNQRMRWAQGWFQVALAHQGKNVQSSRTNGRQKMGHLHLLGWREIYPWISIQMVPILLFWVLTPTRHKPLELFIPIFVLATLFTVSSSIVQIVLAYLLAYPRMRAKKRWFILYFIASQLFYSKIKDSIAIIAQVKEFLGHKEWKVTPRSASPSSIEWKVESI